MVRRNSLGGLTSLESIQQISAVRIIIDSIKWFKNFDIRAVVILIVSRRARLFHLPWIWRHGRDQPCFDAKNYEITI